MSLVSIDPQSPTPLVEQVRAGLAHLIEQRVLRQGNKLPSVRALATQLQVSKFTVADAYERLAALGYLRAHPGSGYYVSHQLSHLPGPASRAPVAATAERAFDHLWLAREQLQGEPHRVQVSAGSLPNELDDQHLIRRALKKVANQAQGALGDYGDPYGYLPLRQLVQLRLAELGLPAQPEQILLTNGATHALETVIRLLISPSDPVLVEDPGYPNLLGNLHLLNAKMLAVPRLADGPDLDALETLARSHRPKLFFVHSLLHNPTGSSLSPAKSHRLLQIAAELDLVLVELDVYADLASPAQTRLATLDGLQRVIHIGALSKSVLGPVRLGYVASSPSMIERLARIKLLSSVTSGQLSERMAYQVLSDTAYRKHLEAVRTHLANARTFTIQQLTEHGLEVFCEPQQGKYVWAKHPRYESSEALALCARQALVDLAPGNVFRPDLAATPWFRLNATQTCSPPWLQFLASLRVKQ
jgi:DNA-binding transcriptional MocR family regulator